ncbi:MAG: TDT family transporter [Candidatus Nanopelagicales bacterium]
MDPAELVDEASLDSTAERELHSGPGPADGRLARLCGALASPLAGDDNSILLGPNWFASVMGTGIIAVAGATLPIRLPGLDALTMAAWVLSASILAVLCVAVGVNWLRRRRGVYDVAHDPVMSQFFGAPPMAFMTVGLGTLLVGSRVIGQGPALVVDWVLWSLGTIGGLVTAAVVPFLLFTRHSVPKDGAFGGWLMPVVPPMVSASTGAALVTHLPPGQGQQTMLFACYAMFGMTLIASLIIITLIWSRLAHFGSSGSPRVPTLWIVLGPIGQSITAAGTLGTAALVVLVVPMSTAFNLMAVLYGVPMWGFGVLWFSIATMLTVRALRARMGFALTWWSFTFPVGTCVTGTTQLAVHTGLVFFQWAAVALYVCLLAAWVTVGIRTTRGAWRGDLLRVKLGAPQPRGRKKGQPATT